jgi:hypothetical protein
LGKRALFGVVARREEGDDASRWAAPGPWLRRAWRGGCLGWAARLGWGQAGLRQSEGKGVAAGPGSAFGPVSAHSQFCYLKFLFSYLFIICKLISIPLKFEFRRLLLAK